MRPEPVVVRRESQDNYIYAAVWCVCVHNFICYCFSWVCVCVGVCVICSAYSSHWRKLCFCELLLLLLFVEWWMHLRIRVCIALFKRHDDDDGGGGNDEVWTKKKLLKCWRESYIVFGACLHRTMINDDRDDANTTVYHVLFDVCLAARIYSTYAATTAIIFGRFCAVFFFPPFDDDFKCACAMIICGRDDNDAKNMGCNEQCTACAKTFIRKMCSIWWK